MAPLLPREAEDDPLSFAIKSPISELTRNLIASSKVGNGKMSVVQLDINSALAI